MNQVAHIATPRPVRRRMRWSLVVAGVAIVGAVLYLVLQGTTASAEYYMTIPELHTCASCASQTVRVAGFVAPDSVQRDAKTQVVHFVIADQATSATQHMAVQYAGIVPDVFHPGIQVVVEGHMQSGVFQAQTLLAKCPSKFQAATPGASGN